MELSALAVSDRDDTTSPDVVQAANDVTAQRIVSNFADWQDVKAPHVGLVIHARNEPNLRKAAEELLPKAPFEQICEGPLKEACSKLKAMPTPIQQDIEQLAQEFAALMQVDKIRIRLEAVTSNACRKIHADYTDLRLITTYAGPTTQVLHEGAKPTEDNLWSMQPGWIGLFKGKTFGEGHQICLHRSPPAGDMDESRLVLVIDTPQFPTEAMDL